MEWRNIMQATVMIVTCALNRRNGTRTKRSMTFEMPFEMPFLHLFANWDIFRSGHDLIGLPWLNKVVVTSSMF